MKTFKVETIITRYIEIPLLGTTIKLPYYGGEIEPTFDVALEYLTRYVCGIKVWTGEPTLPDEITIYTQGQVSMESIIRRPYTDELKAIVTENVDEKEDIYKVLKQLMELDNK